MIQSSPDVQQSCGTTGYISRSLLDLDYKPEAVPAALCGKDLRFAWMSLAAYFSYLYPDVE